MKRYHHRRGAREGGKRGGRREGGGRRRRREGGRAPSGHTLAHSHNDAKLCLCSAHRKKVS